MVQAPREPTRLETRRAFWGQMLVLVALAFLVYLGLSTIGRLTHLYGLRQEESQLRAEIAALEGEHQALQQRKADVQSDAFIEKVAREQLNLIKPGESAVVVVAAPPSVAAVSPVAPATPPPAIPNWRRWWGLFFGD